MQYSEVKTGIEKLLKESEDLIPNEFVSELLPIDGFPDVPQWHRFELELWEKGESIGQLVRFNGKVFKDNELINRVLKICLNPNAKRGRQSFIMLLWKKEFSQFAQQLIDQLDDDLVSGHIIQGLNKMKAAGFCEKVAPFCNHKITWIRKQAVKYIESYG